MGETPFCCYTGITQNSYWVQTRKQWICQTCSNEKADIWPVDGATGITANQRLVVEIFL